MESCFKITIEIRTYIYSIMINQIHIVIVDYITTISKNLLSTCTKPGAKLDIIVPDCKKVAQRIIDEDPFKQGFEAEDIITTYEMVNDMPSPHLSIWTKDRLKYFFELEGRFKIVKTEDNYKFDGRDIYLRSLIERI